MEKLKRKPLSSPESVKAVRWMGWDLWWEGYLEKNKSYQQIDETINLASIDEDTLQLHVHSCIETVTCALNSEHWCTAGPGRSRNPCSEQYNGWQAFSEPETRAIADYILSLTSTTPASNVNDDDDDDSDNDVGGLLIYVSLHSYGQHLLTPWGYTRQPPSDYLDLVSPYLA